MCLSIYILVATVGVQTLGEIGFSWIRAFAQPIQTLSAIVVASKGSSPFEQNKLTAQILLFYCSYSL